MQLVKNNWKDIARAQSELETGSRRLDFLRRATLVAIGLAFALILFIGILTFMSVGR